MIQVYKGEENGNDQGTVKYPRNPKNTQATNNTEKYQRAIDLNPISHKLRFKPILNKQ